QGTLDGLHLTVHDDGVGFDPDKALKSDGIGIISMRERVRFVNGTLAIQSRLNGGTTIEVDVPLKDVMADSQTA
ncbi:MAG TPA: ATP-binding protein, partial [Terriglobales bacterium]|nr:ATP-binding protein [Terriglobales bacterium]